MLVMRPWDMWGALWTLVVLAQLAGVLSTPLEPAPLSLKGEDRIGWSFHLGSHASSLLITVLIQSVHIGSVNFCFYGKNKDEF